MFKATLFAALLMLTGLVNGQNLTRTELDKTISISVPEGFKRLSGAQAQARSLSFREPLGVFVDANGDADLVVNTANAFFDAKDIEIMRDFYRANIRSLYTKVQFTKDAIETVSGKRGLVFEFTAEVADRSTPKPIRKYICAHYGLRKRRVVVATFSSEEKTRVKWAKTAQAALASLKISEK